MATLIADSRSPGRGRGPKAYAMPQATISGRSEEFPEIKRRRREERLLVAAEVARGGGNGGFRPAASSDYTGARLAIRWGPLFHAYQHYGLILYAILLLKNLSILLLKSGPLQHLIWLDCYIPGRPLISSRIPETSKYATVLFDSFLILQRVLFRQVRPDFNYYCLELTYLNHKLFVSHNWLPKWLSSKRSKAKEAPTAAARATGGDAEEAAAAIGPSLRDPLPQDKHPALERFVINHLNTSQLIWRPTRTPAWRYNFAKLYLLAVSLTTSINVLLLCLCCLMLGPIIFTRRGFELTRKDCVLFLVNNKSAQVASGAATTAATTTTSAATSAAGWLPTGSWLNYDSIYQVNTSQSLNELYPNKPAPLFQPYVDLVPLNAYHVTRIFFDLLETASIWLGLGASYTCHLYCVVAVSVDANVYVNHLHQKLVELTRKLGEARGERDRQRASLQPVAPVYSAIRRLPLKLPINWKSHLAGSCRVHEQSEEQEAEITAVQASILDYFNMIAFYNPYVGLSTFIDMCVWLFYTFLIFVRFLRLDRLQTVVQLDSGVHAEFMILFAVGFFLLFVLLASASILESRSRQLYRHMTRAMALDMGLTSTKLRWIPLLNHFEPERLHCFTMFNHTSLSWLFCLKLVSWVVSVLFILMSI